MNLRRTSTIRALGLAVFASAALAMPLQAQTDARVGQTHGEAAAATAHEHAAAAPAGRQAMMGEMHASVAKLQELVAKMNAASGDAKIEQIAAIVNELVAQHTGMMQQMMSMHDGEMMQKMRTDRPSSGDATEASGTPDAEGDHSQHHPPEP